MKHEVFAIFPFERIDDLLVLTGPERRHRERLRLASGKQRRAVRPGQDADLTRNGSDGAMFAAIDLPFSAQNRPPDDLLFNLLEKFDRDRPLRLVGEQLNRLRLGRVEPIAAILLALLAIGGFDQRADCFAQPPLDRSKLRRCGRHAPRLAGAGFGEVDDAPDHRLEFTVAEDDRPEHDVLGKFFRLGFDHQHALGRAGDDEIELRARQLCQRRVQDVVPLDKADARPANRAEERDPRDRQRCRRADHRHDIGIVFQVMAQNRADYLRFVNESGNE